MKTFYFLWAATLLTINPAAVFSQNAFTSQIDSVINRGNGRVYFQRGNQYIRFDPDTRKADPGYPQQITSLSWPGVPFAQIDAAMDFGNGKIYLFMSNRYLRFDKKKNRMDDGYPKEINNSTWPGLTFTAVDAAFNGGNGKIYFFRGSEYVRYDIAADQADLGYPKKISNSTWPGLTFSKIDAVTRINNKAYFFYGEEFVSFDMKSDKADAGYPKQISAEWNGLRFPLSQGEVTGADSEPEKGKDESAAEGTSFRVTKKSVTIFPGVINSSTSVLGRYYMAVQKNGNIWFGYQSGKNTGIIALDSTFNRRGSVINLQGYFLSQLMAMDDGSLMVLAGRAVNNTYLPDYANALYLLKLDSTGHEIFNTYLFGGTGHGPGKAWFDGRSMGQIAYNGHEFGVYFEVQKNWAEAGESDDIHNGDMFVFVDSKGKLLDDRTHFWTASHSSTIHVAAGSDGEFYTTTIGDAYPYGLQFYNRNRKEETMLWPPAGDYVPYEKVKSTNAAGILEFFAPSGNDFITLMGTLEHPNLGVFDKVDVLFFRFDKKGKILKQKWLTRTKDFDESAVFSVPVGNNFLIAWGTGNDYDNNWEPGNVYLSLVNSDGEFIITPREAAFPLGTYSRLYSLPGNRAIWPLADNQSSTVDFYIVEIK